MAKVKGSRGKSGGKRNRAGDSRPRVYRPMESVHRNANSPTSTWQDAAGYFQCAEIDESVQDHVIPRRSLSRQQHLAIFPQQVEVEPVISRQLDKRTGRMVEVINNRLTWKSDRTLLRRDKPQEHIGNRLGNGAYGFMRLTSSSKRRKVEVEEKLDTPIEATFPIDEKL